MQQVKHYFVGTLPLESYYSASLFEQQVLELLTELFRDSDYALMSGGSMMYIDAVCNGIDDIPTIDDCTRATMKRRLKEEGLEKLCEELRKIDPEYYQIVDRHNTKRVVHALEICYQTGRPYSSYLSQQTKQRPFRIVKIGLLRPREELFSRINQRTLQMLDLGFEQEARRVYPLRHLNSLNTVGYKEMFRYISGEWSLPQTIEKIQRNTRVYAKKQMTWFQRDPDINWFRPDEEEKILDFVEQNSAD
jgi:tRNA dimethylallyltransferase